MVLGVVGLTLAALATVPFTSAMAHKEAVAWLSEHFESEVELKELDLRLLPLRARGKGLTVRHKGRRDVPPLISIAEFTADGGFSDLFRSHLSKLTVVGLEIQIPPKNRPSDSKDSSRASAPTTSPEASRPDESKDEPEDVTDASESDSDLTKTFVIDELESNDARLVILRRDPEKDPRVWQIHRLRMRTLAIDRAMPFEAQLTNAVPPGQIDVKGHFGPWGRDDPGRTPLDGTFTFDKADLGVFKGISGILSAHGSFKGTLERLEVQGETDTPEFTVSASDLPVPLKTKYHAVVDGTNGDTILERVDASFLETSMVAKGGVVHTPGRKGRTVFIDVVIGKGRIADVLRLAIKNPQPPMTGGLKLDAKLVLPPGDQDVVKKLQLDGAFDIENARFTDADVQRKINELSRRGSGKVKEEPASQRVTSDFSGSFTLGNGVLTIPQVVFDVPGAAVELAGTYNLESEVLDFSGMFFMDATISQTTTGFKSVLLKMVDPLFKKRGGGSAIPIRISGQRGSPSFGLDKGRIFNRS